MRRTNVSVVEVECVERVEQAEDWEPEKSFHTSHLFRSNDDEEFVVVEFGFVGDDKTVLE